MRPSWGESIDDAASLFSTVLRIWSGVVGGVFPSADLVVSLTAKSYWMDHNSSTLGGFVHPTILLPLASVGVLSFIEPPDEQGARRSFVACALTAVRSSHETVLGRAVVRTGIHTPSQSPLLS